LEPETAGQFERGMNQIPQNASQRDQTGQNRIAKALAPDAVDKIYSL